MGPAAAAAAALVVVLLLLLAGAFAWYHNPRAWKSFSYAGGDAVAFSTDGAPLDRLRFRGCTFATVNPQGLAAQWDVTAVLNGMAAAYDVPISKSELTLGGSARIPLNPFSFTRAGYNDPATVPTAAASTAWGAAPPAATRLVGQLRVLR